MINRPKHKTVALIQARMGSSRLPGKPLLKLAGTPMIEWIFKRLEKCPSIDEICVATTTNPLDDRLVAFLERKSISYYRGSEQDIVDRLYSAAKWKRAHTIVRIWGDCPLIDPGVIQLMLKRYFEAKPDFVTNGQPPTYPFGFNAEIYSVRTLKNILRLTTNAFYREYPHSFIRNTSYFRVLNVSSPKNYSHIHVTVDYPEDAALVEKFIISKGRKNTDFDLNDLVDFFTKNRPDFEKNRRLKRNIEFKRGLKRQRVTKYRKRNMKVLVIGCGSIGHRHIRNLLSLNVGPVFAYDVSTSRLRMAQQLSPEIRTSRSLDDLWAGQPEVVFIATPTAIHVDYAIEAAKRGCHLFIEKPLSANLRRLDRLINIVQRKRLKTFVAYNYRFNEQLHQVRKFLQGNKAGRLISCRTEAGSYLPERHIYEDYRQGYGSKKDLGGGVLLDSISHHLDYWIYLLGQPKEVLCVLGRRSGLEIDVEDAAEALLRFADGLVVSLRANFLQRPYKHEIEIVGEKGTIRCDFVQQKTEVYDVKRRQWKTFDRFRDFNEYYVMEVDYFLKCVQEDKRPEPDVIQGKQAMELLNKMRKSNQQRKWVKV